MKQSDVAVSFEIGAYKESDGVRCGAARDLDGEIVRRSKTFSLAIRNMHLRGGDYLDAAEHGYLQNWDQHLAEIIEMPASGLLGLKAKREAVETYLMIFHQHDGWIYRLWKAISAEIDRVMELGARH
jgi:hypothetical protein